MSHTLHLWMACYNYLKRLIRTAKQRYCITSQPIRLGLTTGEFSNPQPVHSNSTDLELLKTLKSCQLQKNMTSSGPNDLTRLVNSLASALELSLQEQQRLYLIHSTGMKQAPIRHTAEQSYTQT